MFEFSVPAVQGTRQFGLSATPGRRRLTPKDLKNVAYAGSLEINTVGT